MFKDITIGQYYPTGSFIHELDPRTKIFGTMLYMIMLFFIKSYIGFIWMFAFLMIPIVVSKIPISYILKGIKGIVFIILLTVTLNMFMTPGEEIFRLGFLKITREGLSTAILMSIRLILLVSATSLLTLVTSPISLTDGMERLIKKIPLLGMYAHEMAMMMSIALRFIPTLMEETSRIIDAQKSRGADFESGNIVKRATAFLPVLIPLFISSFQRAEDLALAMEARCYRGGQNRTRMNAIEYTRKDGIAYAYIFFVFAFVVLTYYLSLKGII